MAAGVVFHKPCHYSFGDNFCTTAGDYYNYTARIYLAGVNVGRADALTGQVSSRLRATDFADKDPRYPIQDGDVVKFVFKSNMPNELTEGK